LQQDDADHQDGEEGEDGEEVEEGEEEEQGEGEESEEEMEELTQDNGVSKDRVETKIFVCVLSRKYIFAFCKKCLQKVT
jgi:hypothetical protein